MFDRAADTYDQLGVDFFTPMGRDLAALSGLRAGERVLDLGAGRGAVTFAAAEAVGADGEVCAIDIAPSMVERLRDDVRERGLSTVQVSVGDAEAPVSSPRRSTPFSRAWRCSSSPSPHRHFAPCRVAAPGRADRVHDVRRQRSPFRGGDEGDRAVGVRRVAARTTPGRRSARRKHRDAACTSAGLDANVQRRHPLESRFTSHRSGLVPWAGSHGRPVRARAGPGTSRRGRTHVARPTFEDARVARR